MRWYVVHYFTPLYDLKAAQMNAQHYLIWKLMLYEFELDLNAAEETKIFIDHRTVSKKFRLGCQTFDNQARSARPKTVDTEAVLQP